jgi:hypothetical protein
LPKVPASFSRSPQRGERARVRGDRKKLLANGIVSKKFDKRGTEARSAVSGLGTYYNYLYK